MPVWHKLALIALGVICLVLLGAQALLNGYIAQQVAQREAAHQRVVDNHPLKYRDWIEAYAAQNNLEPAFVAAIIMNESSFRPQAVSSVDARGLMQLMADTAGWIAGKVDEPNYSFERMWDPQTNIRFGCWYLGFLAQRFYGDPVSVACAYHAGQGEIEKWRSQPGVLDSKGHLILEKIQDGPSKNYARKVTEDYGVYQQLYFRADAPLAQ